MNGNTKKNYDPLDPLGGARLANLALDPLNLLDLRDKDGNYDPWRLNRNSNRGNHFGDGGAASPAPFSTQPSQYDTLFSSSRNNFFEDRGAASAAPFSTQPTQYDTLFSSSRNNFFEDRGAASAAPFSTQPTQYDTPFSLSRNNFFEDRGAASAAPSFTQSTEVQSTRRRTNASSSNAVEPNAPPNAPVAGAQASRNSIDMAAKQLTSQPRTTGGRLGLPVESRHHEQPILPDKSSVGATMIGPYHPDGIEIAIICALAREYDAVFHMFKDVWKDGGNNYKTGRIGEHNVVLAPPCDMGKKKAATAASTICSTYRYVRLCILVGICGGVPQTNGKEILLGDVVISKAIVEYDFGSEYSNGFACKNGIKEPHKDIRNQLLTLETDHGKRCLEEKTSVFLRQFQDTATQQRIESKYSYPGTDKDKLFKPDYRHKHRQSPVCSTCKEESDLCETAIGSSCNDLGCDEKYLVPGRQLVRQERERVQDPAIHVGYVGSADKVMKSGKVRNAAAKKHNIIAFEMEGAGVVEELSCVVVKGVCDYADCHKNKEWQDFAAATAASTLKAILETIPASKSGPPQSYLLPALFCFTSGFVALAWVILNVRRLGA